MRRNEVAPNVPNPQSDGFVPVNTTLKLEIKGDIELILGWQSNIVFTTRGPGAGGPALRRMNHKRSAAT